MLDKYITRFLLSSASNHQNKYTDFLYSEVLSASCKNKIYLKAEYQQKAFSYHFRGAFDYINEVSSCCLSGVIASDGCLALSVALVAKLLKFQVTIVVPNLENEFLINQIKYFGKECVDVISYGKNISESNKHAQYIALKSGSKLLNLMDAETTIVSFP